MINTVVRTNVMWTLKYCVLLSALTVLQQLHLAHAASELLHRKQFVTLHKWTNLRMTFPTEDVRKWALKHGVYDKKKPLPVDIDVEYGDDGYHRTFLTIPRLSNGVPYSLAVVSDDDNSTVSNPRVTAYPDYQWHASNGLNCSGITSAIRTFIDECWRLWVVDSGQIGSLQYCAPQILAFDLVADQLVHRYVFPNDLYTAGVSIFTALAVDVGEAEPRSECRDTMVYIADAWGYGLIVYDMLAKQSWRIEDELMRPDKQLTRQNSASDGIFTVSLSPKGSAKARQLYFHALNSYKEISAPLQLINNASRWLDVRKKDEMDEQVFRVMGNRGLQCESEAMDSGGNLYCSLISSNALIAWKEDEQYNSDNLKVVAYNPEQLKFLTGLKVNRNSAEEDELWALSTDPRLFVGGAVRPDEVKFRILGCRTKNLQNNEPCSVGAAQK